MIKHVIQKMRLSKMAAAFNTWKAIAATQAAAQYKVGGAIICMLHRKLSMSFEKWQAEAAAIKHEKHPTHCSWTGSCSDKGVAILYKNEKTLFRV